MKKIMFSDKFGLTDAVLDCRKIMTRRVIAKPDGLNVPLNEPTYKIGEEVAIAQKYRDLCNCDAFYDALHKADPTFPLECIKYEKGNDNMMYVKADWMPHRIRIVDVKTERLQDISDDDVLKEGFEWQCINNGWGNAARHWEVGLNYMDKLGRFKVIRSREPRAAFAYLINKMMGRGTWESNPWVFAYEFRLLR